MTTPNQPWTRPMLVEFRRRAVSTLVRGVAKCFNNSDHADVTIQIDGFRLPAHSLVLSIQSDYFGKALRGPFLESKTKTLSFKGNAQAHWRVFQFMYTGQYSTSPSPHLSASDDDDLIKHVNVYVLGDYFLVDNLKQLAILNLECELEELNLATSEQACDAAIKCIKAVYSLTKQSDPLQQVVVDVAFRNAKSLWTKPSFQELFREVGDFAVEFTGKLTAMQGSGSRAVFPHRGF